MEEEPNDSSLLLPDLYIENFRGIKKLSIPRLGRVTLLAGKNGVGKTSTLEAVQVYAARGRKQVLSHVLDSRDEITTPHVPRQDGLAGIDWAALFYGRTAPDKKSLSIGPSEEACRLSVTAADGDNEHPAFASFPRYVLARQPGERMRVYEIKCQGAGYYIIPTAGGGSLAGGNEPPPELKCELVGPDALARSDVARMWYDVALTDDEEKIAKSIGLVYGVDVERIGLIGDDAGNGGGDRLRCIVRPKGSGRPAPLRSLGEGAMRLFGIALALANSRDGFLLIDEAENGIHHSAQRDFWRMVLQTAHENNVQVFATTHSWDCVSGFAQAAVQNENVEGVLVRLEKEENGLRAVRYDEEDLETAADQNIEVR